MSLHEDLMLTIQSEIEGQRIKSPGGVSPTSIAVAAQSMYVGRQKLEPHIEYTSLEHFKQLARQILGKRFDPDGEENEAHPRQGEMWSGTLQTMYPTPTSRGEEPCYKDRKNLNALEVAWNVSMLRKSAKARTAHADALQAWWANKLDDQQSA